MKVYPPLPSGSFAKPTLGPLSKIATPGALLGVAVRPSLEITVTMIVSSWVAMVPAQPLGSVQDVRVTGPPDTSGT